MSESRESSTSLHNEKELTLRWGMYYRNDPVRIWAISGPTTMHPSWWPYAWSPMRDTELYRTGINWDHEPSLDEIADAIRTFEQ